MSTELGAAARHLYAARRERDAIFGEDSGGFGEPGWDMLLLLFAADADGARVTVPELLASVPFSAAVAPRYVEWLTSRRLAIQTNAGDIVIADRGRELLIEYLSTPTTI